MNLIEQLGGYRMAKEVRDNIPKDGRSYTITRDDTGISFNTSKLHDALLEHRRQHNIFEVGDKVVILHGVGSKNIYTVDELSDGFYLIRNDYLLPEEIRHATDAEIKAGCRL